MGISLTPHISKKHRAQITGSIHPLKSVKALYQASILFLWDGGWGFPLLKMEHSYTLKAPMNG